MSGGPTRAGLVKVAAILGPHGVRGSVRIKGLTDDPDGFLDLGPFTDEGGGRVFRLVAEGPTKGGVRCRIDGVRDRTDAETLKGQGLFVPRDRLPPPEDEDEFFYDDLIGLACVDTNGAALGRVHAMAEFGAGDVVEIALDDAARAARSFKPTTVMVPFTKEAVPVVDLAAGRLVIDPPVGLFEPPGHRPEDEVEDGAREDPGE